MKGWTFVGAGARKAHYFDVAEGKHGGASLCGRWAFLGIPEGRLEDEAYQSPDNCKGCMRKLKKKYPELWEKDAEEYSYRGSASRTIEK